MLKGQIKEFIKSLNKKIDDNDESKIKTLKNIFIDLKNNLVLSNMILVFGVITLAFITIFIFMKQTLSSDSQLTMKSIIYKNSIINTEYDNKLIAEVDKEGSNDEINSQTSEDESGYIYIEYSGWNNIITHNNIKYTIKSEALIDAFEKLVGDQAQGITEWNEINYRYLVNKNQFPAGTYKIVFYNLSSENRFLKYLAIGLILLDIILSFISYLISVFITNRSLEPIRETIEKQKRFTEDASHELRTPLTVLQTNMEVLKSDPDLTIKDQYKWIGYIDDEIKRMSKLVTELLTLSRLDNNKHNEEFEDFNMTEELFKIIEAYSKFVKTKDLELKSNIDKNVIFTCQPNKIKQLINIFLDNAIKYNIPGGYIEISLKKKIKNFDLIIEDSGVGIAKEDQKKIFNRFFRGDLSRSTEGTGLGLSIAQQIIEKHKGKVKVISSEGKGTKFIITFPYNGEF